MWPWAAALAALFLILEAYGPALNGPFVLDDRYLPFFKPDYQSIPLSGWINGLRPLLMFSFWMNYAANGIDPYVYHVTNVVLHLLNSVLVALIAAKLLEWAGTEKNIARSALGVFAGALFLLHPIQTEAVAYVASRSEVLSVFFYYAAYCVFLYRRSAQITWLRAIAVLALFGAAASTKEHTLTLPVLLLLTDLYWGNVGRDAMPRRIANPPTEAEVGQKARLQSVRANLRLYGMLAIGAALGAIGVARVLSSADTAGFRVPGLTPINYFFTQCRVVWMYVRLVLLPIGQNLDPDIAITRTALDPAAWLGLLAAAALIVAAWIYRRRWPLAAFGVFVFFLLLAPTSSIVPIQDPMAERRVYLPFLGLALIAIEFLRYLKLRQRVMIEVPVLVLLFVLTYQRSTKWASPLALWTDAVEKSPRKLRPRSQLAFAYYEQQNCQKAAESYEIASRLAPPDYPLLVNWAYSLDCGGFPDEAIQRLREATRRETDPQAWALLGMVYGKQHKTAEALASLDEAQKLNPNYVMTFAVRGNVYESIGDIPNAIQQYQRAAVLDPNNEPVRQSLARALSKNH
ncbi:MAG: tetratricopeptide repeat protein [Bryobacterales bacterium]|nr:tetratricopeptide repeat protein [Bryobacterales bacterium]